MRVREVTTSSIPIGFVFLWLLVGGVFLAIGFVLDFWIFLLVGGVAFVIGWISLALYLFSYLSQQRVGVPILLYEERPFQIGEAVSVQVDLDPARTIDINGMKLALIFHERATYDQGTDTVTVTKDHVVDERSWPARRLRPGELFSEEVTLQIPADGMHSFEVRRNALLWLLQFSVDVPRLPDVQVTETLTVAPIRFRSDAGDG